MLNPILSKVEIFFSSEFFPPCMSKKYNDWLFHINHPFKNIEDFFIESIQNVTIPGINVPSLQVNNIPNKSFGRGDEHMPVENRFFEGHEPWFNAIENSVVTLTFRNNILNWMYCYEMLYNRYKRNNRVDRFFMIFTLKDSADIPMVKLSFSDCWIENLPALEMSFNSAFNESKTFDATIKFNKFDVDLAIPEFEKMDLGLKP